MEFQITAFRGANIFCKAPAIAIKPSPEWLAALESGRKSLDEEIRLHLEPWLDADSHSANGEPENGIFALVLGLVGGLHRMAGLEVTYSGVRTEKPGPPPAMYFELVERGVSRVIGGFAMDLVANLVVTPVAKWQRQLERIIGEQLERIDKLMVNANTRFIIREARNLGVPWFFLNDDVLQLGQGSNQKRMGRSFSSNTSHLSFLLSSDKFGAAQVLGKYNLPVPGQRHVRSEQQLLQAIRELDGPLVVKPIDSDYGTGITFDVTTSQQAVEAYNRARKTAHSVLVEETVDGHDHRLLVVNGRLVAAAKRMPASVTGDGRSSIKELVTKKNAEPGRGIAKGSERTKIKIDQEAVNFLARKSLGLDSVPVEGEIIYLRRLANLSLGGDAIDVTDTVHPDNIKMAELAAALLDIDIAGIDFITSDISQSWKTSSGAICEVNTSPGLRMHYAPTEGIPRQPGKAIIDYLFPDLSRARIPLVAVTGTNGKTTTSTMLDSILRENGLYTGLASTNGIYVNGDCIEPGDKSGPEPASKILMHPLVDAAVLECARGAALKYGLAFDWCNVTVVTNVQADHLGNDGIDTIEQMAGIKQLIAETGRDAVVLNADDRLCMAMRENLSAQHIWLVSLDPGEEVYQHINKGDPGVVLEEEQGQQLIRVYESATVSLELDPRTVPATLNGKAGFNIQNAMFAVAAAKALLQPESAIRTALGKFTCDFETIPGRLNFVKGLPFDLVVDFGHNADGVASVSEWVDSMEPRGRKICALTSPGNRQDEHFINIGKEAAGHYDHYICHSWVDLRKRSPEYVPEKIKAGLLEGGVLEDDVSVIAGEHDTLKYLLETSSEGDLVVMFVEQHREAMEIIRQFQARMNLLPE